MGTDQARAVLGAVVGAVLGFVVGAGVYLALGPMLEAADGPVRELQGLTWNLVPVGTVGGALLGWVLARRGGTGGDRH
jgi:hypothetical protein